jgi:hypothetical protein
MDGDDFVNIMNPGTGNLSRVGWVGDDSELVDTCKGQGLLLDGTKRLDGGASAFCDFTVQNFSIEWWFQMVDLTHAHYLWQKGTLNTNGILIISGNAGDMQVYTSQGAANQLTQSNLAIFNTTLLHHAIVTRSGQTVRIYANGEEVAYNAVGVHVNPISASGNNLYVYSRNVNTLNLDGYGAPARVWEGRALGAADVRSLYIYGPNRT